MSHNPETDLDLEKLFLPAWATQPADVNRYAKYEGDSGDREDRRGPRRDRPGGFGGPREGGRRDERRDRLPRRDFSGPRREGERRGPPGPGGAPGQRPDRPGGPRPQFEGQRGPGGPRRGERPDRFARGERREPKAPPLPELVVTFTPDGHGVDSMVRQIRVSGRAFPLFQIASLVLQKAERHSVTIAIKKNPQGQPIQPLFLCALDDTLWLSEPEAVDHLMSRHFGTFYQTERVASEPPKGKYTFVAQCGMSGVILGPPNYHDYQNALRKLHLERFSRMPFDDFKARVKIVRDEEVVKKWVEEQSWKTEYVCLNVPEATRLPDREAVVRHFRETHLPTVVKPVENHTLTGASARNQRCSELLRLVRIATEHQKRFPMQLATVLSTQFAQRGLQFFKVNKTITHVSVARPRYLDLEAAPVSEGVRKIVEFINATPKCTRRLLIEALAPTPAAPPVAETAATGAEAPTASGGAVQPTTPAAPAPALADPTPEQTLVIADLHWLIHQGHVIEFASGTLETAKKPLPKPPKPEPKPPEAGAKPTVEAPAAPAAETPTEASLAAEAAAFAAAHDDAQSAAGAEAPAPEPGVGGTETPPASEAASATNGAAAAEPPPTEATLDEKPAESAPPTPAA